MSNLWVCILKNGCPLVISERVCMKEKNQSGSVTIQTIKKINRINKVIRTISSPKDPEEIERPKGLDFLILKF